MASCSKINEDSFIWRCSSKITLKNGNMRNAQRTLCGMLWKTNGCVVWTTLFRHSLGDAAASPTSCCIKHREYVWTDAHALEKCVQSYLWMPYSASDYTYVSWHIAFYHHTWCSRVATPVNKVIVILHIDFSTWISFIQRALGMIHVVFLADLHNSLVS